MNQGIKVVKIALLGLGTVGSGVYKLIEEKGEEFEKRTGAKIQIEKILVHNLKKERPGVKKCLLTDQWKEIIENDEIELVIEGWNRTGKSYDFGGVKCRKKCSDSE